MKKILFAVAVVALLGVAGTAVAAKPTQDNNDNKPEFVSLCHKTASATNPWVVQEVKANELQSHLDNGDKLYAGPLKDNGHPDQKAGDTWCNEQNPQPHVPVPCVAGYHETGKADNGDSICAKDDDPVVPTGTTADSNKGEVPTDPVTGEVFYGK